MAAPHGALRNSKSVIELIESGRRQKSYSCSVVASTARGQTGNSVGRGAILQCGTVRHADSTAKLIPVSDRESGSPRMNGRDSGIVHSQSMRTPPSRGLQLTFDRSSASVCRLPPIQTTTCSVKTLPSTGTGSATEGEMDRTRWKE